VAKCDVGLRFRLGGMIWASLGMVDLAFSLSLKWQWASQP